MTLASLQQPLEDSLVLDALATAAGITRAEARGVLAALAEVPIRQAIRMAKTCQADQRRAHERAKRMGR